jgi:hypothetical protein
MRVPFHASLILVSIQQELLWWHGVFMWLCNAPCCNDLWQAWSRYNHVAPTSSSRMATSVPSAQLLRESLAGVLPSPRRWNAFGGTVQIRSAKMARLENHTFAHGGVESAIVRILASKYVHSMVGVRTCR